MENTEIQLIIWINMPLLYGYFAHFRPSGDELEKYKQ